MVEPLARILAWIREVGAADIKPQEEPETPITRAIGRAQAAQAKRLGYRDAAKRYDPED